jgi:hypothetical protein
LRSRHLPQTPPGPCPLTFLPAAAAHGLVPLGDLLALITLPEPAAAASANELRLLLLGPGFAAEGAMVAAPAAACGLGAMAVPASPGAARGQEMAWTDGGTPVVTACGAGSFGPDLGEAWLLAAAQLVLSPEKAAEALAPALLPAVCSGLNVAAEGEGAAVAAARVLSGGGAAGLSAAAALAGHGPLRAALLAAPAAAWQGLSGGGGGGGGAQRPPSWARSLSGIPPAALWGHPARLALQSLAAGGLLVMLGGGGGCLLVQASKGEQGAGTRARLSWQQLPPAAPLPAAALRVSGPAGAEAPLSLGLVALLRCVSRPGWLAPTAVLVGALREEAALSEALRRPGADAAAALAAARGPAVAGAAAAVGGPGAGSPGGSGGARDRALADALLSALALEAAVGPEGASPLDDQVHLHAAPAGAAFSAAVEGTAGPEAGAAVAEGPARAGGRDPAATAVALCELAAAAGRGPCDCLLQRVQGLLQVRRSWGRGKCQPASGAPGPAPVVHLDPCGPAAMGADQPEAEPRCPATATHPILSPPPPRQPRMRAAAGCSATRASLTRWDACCPAALLRLRPPPPPATLAPWRPHRLPRLPPPAAAAAAARGCLLRPRRSGGRLGSSAGSRRRASCCSWAAPCSASATWRLRSWRSLRAWRRP